MDPACELAQLAQRRLQLGLGLGEQLRIGLVVAQQLQHQAEGQQSLLGAIVQVALDAPALSVGRGDHPRTGRTQLVELGAQLRL